MTKQAVVRRVFPGGNTSKGFYSYYDNILKQEEAKRIIVLKGGPGVGKSSFMKKLGKSMEQRGFDVEYHHCSSDNNSIDGVVFPEVGVALLDGTAPHVVDPKNPGAVDEIIHLGDFWDEEMMMANKEAILKVNAEVGRNFRRAYGYLASAKGVYDNIQANIEAAINKAQVNKIIEQLITEIFGRITFGSKVGKERHLFGSAITPGGIMDHVETILEPNEMIFVLYGKYNSAQSIILDKLGKVAIDKGYNVEYFHNHFIPEKIDHLVIKDLGIALTTKKINNINYKYVNIDDCLNNEIILERESELQDDLEVFDSLVQNAVSNIIKAKKTHDILEEYYIPNIDFRGVDELREKILNKILVLSESN